MLNKVTTIYEQGVWVTLCKVQKGHNYKISYMPTEITSVGLHLHSEDGAHKLSFSRPGTSAVGGFTYNYSFVPKEDGELVMKSSNGKIKNIVVEEVV